MRQRVPVGVLASGGGTNLQALIDACAEPTYPASIAVVLSDRPLAGALDRAREAGIPTEIVRRPDHRERAAFDRALVAALQKHGVQWVALAGFMRLIGRDVLDAFPQRVLNIHPSLLPSFPGLKAVEQALDRGVRVTGCTVHLVDEGTDSGPILGQAVVPVRPDDDAERLHARILAREHQLYRRCLRWAVEGRIQVDGRRVSVNIPPKEDPWMGVDDT